MNNSMLPLPGVSSASGKPVVVKFDGGLLSSDGGVLERVPNSQNRQGIPNQASCD